MHYNLLFYLLKLLQFVSDMTSFQIAGCGLTRFSLWRNPTPNQGEHFFISCIFPNTIRSDLIWSNLILIEMFLIRNEVSPLDELFFS